MATELAAEASKATGKEKRPRTTSDRAFLALIGLMALGLVGLGLFALPSSGPGPFFSTLSFMFFLAAATTLVGALTGFVFGIPRALQRAESEQPAPAPPNGERGVATEGASDRPTVGYGANTNLEQISDWLTKILVGVGLTQLIVLPDNLWILAGSLSSDMAGLANAQAVVATTIVFYGICGFLVSYLWTRLYLAGMLREADLQALERKVDEKLSALDRQTRCDAAALSLAEQCLSPRSDTPEVSHDEVEAAIVEASPAARTTIFYRAWGVRRNYWDKDKNKMARTIPIFEALIAADTADEYHKNHGQLGLALKDQTKPKWREAHDELSRAIEIRGDSKRYGWEVYEWNRAVCAINMEKDGLVDDKAKPKLHAQIVSDLKTAHQFDELLEWTRKEPDIMAWLDAHQLSLDQVLPDS